MEILKLNAPCKDYIWGGNRLREEYGKVSDADKRAGSCPAIRTVRALLQTARTKARRFPSM
mgnify:CR=1 FL=1